MRLTRIFFLVFIATLSFCTLAKAEDIALTPREAFCTLIHLDRYLSIERIVIRYDPSRCPPPMEFASMRSVTARAISYEAMSCFADNLQRTVIENDNLMDLALSHCDLPIKSILLGETSLAEALQLGSVQCQEALAGEDESTDTNPFAESDRTIVASTQCIE